MPHLLICRTVDGFGGHLDVFHDPMCLLTNINRSYCEEKTKSEQKTDCDWFDSISRPKGVFHLISIFLHLNLARVSPSTTYELG